MSGIDDLNFEDLVDGAINTIDDAKTEKFEAKKLLKPKLKTGTPGPILAEKPKGDLSDAPTRERERVTDETIEMLDDTARMNDPPGGGPPEIPGKASGGSATFEHIYMRAGVQPGEFTVFRLEELFEDEDLAGLDEKGKVAAIKAILKSHDIEFDVIIEDAVARRSALDAHDQRLKSNIQRVEREMEKENAKLQAEIEEYANPRIERMEKNNERVDRLRRDYAEWHGRKQVEHNRIVDILSPWGGDARLRHDRSAPPDDAAVSGDEAFEPVSAAADEVEAPRAVDDSLIAAAGADQWKFDDPTLDPPELAEVARIVTKAQSVSTDLPSSYEPAEPLEPAMTGEFDEFRQSRMRIPRTAVEWMVTLFALLIAIPVAFLLAAQLDMITAPGAILIGFVAAPLIALLPTVFTRHRNDFWSGWVVWWIVFTIVAFGAAHIDGPKLVTNLTKRPLWFIQELGMAPGATAQIESSVHNLTRPYAEAIAPVFGASDALWSPPAQGEDAQPAAEEAPKAAEKVAPEPAPEPAPTAAPAADGGTTDAAAAPTGDEAAAPDPIE